MFMFFNFELSLLVFLMFFNGTPLFDPFNNKIHIRKITYKRCIIDHITLDLNHNQLSLLSIMCLLMHNSMIKP